MRVDQHTNEFVEEVTYFIVKKKTCIIVDPGSDFDKIDSYLQQNDFEHVAIYLTHGHSDHMFSAKKLYEKYQMPVYVDKREMRLILGQASRIEKEIGAHMLTENFTYLEESLDFFGIHMDIIYVPGHSEGHTMALVEECNALFVGDFIFQGTIGRCDLPTGDFAKMKQSLKLLSTMNYNLKLYPGHGPVTTLRDEMNNNMYLAEFKK